MKKLGSILVVDDMLSNLHLIEAMLDDDYNIILAQSGDEALKILSSDVNIDLIILDIIMPNMDGYTVCKKIKLNSSTENIPVIFLSSENSEESEEKAFIIGGIDYIKKPVSPIILSIRVKTHITLKHMQESLREKALRDHLTSLHNRHYLEDSGQKAFYYAKRYNQELGIVMIDIDHFKSVNDTYGHNIGDIVLKELANLLKINIRKEDILARIGGEEFIIILTNSNIKNSISKIEDIRTKVEALNPNNINITISCGITQFNDSSEDIFELLKEADLALYESKNNGRNKCTIFNK